MPATNFVSASEPSPHPSLKPRIIAVYLGLAIATVLAWGWALMEFSGRPVLLGSALLAYVLGVRHALDPDHIAAIDNVTRKLMQENKRPVSVGLWFALGHSSLIIVATLVVALTATNLANGPFEDWRAIGGTISTSISAAFLLLIALFNILVLRGVWKTMGEVRRTGRYVEEDLDILLGQRGLVSRVLRPLFGLISKAWHLYPLGFLFGLGFDTATEISLFGLSATAAGGADGIPVLSVLVFPALFTAGMTLVDTTDGILMLGAYGWAYVKPVRKLFYNFTITAVSAAVAVFIGGIEALGLIADKLQLSGAPWSWIGAVNARFGVLGFAIVGLFVLAWGASLLAYRLGRFDEIPVSRQTR